MVENVVCVSENAKVAAFPTWVLREYKAAQEQENQNEKKEGDYNDGSDQHPRPAGSSMPGTIEDELFNVEPVYIKVRRLL